MSGNSVPSDAVALDMVKPLLVSRASLHRANRKATCWLFFREVGIQPEKDGASGMETLLGCRCCQPNVVDSTTWASVWANRSGLVKYSDLIGTSEMRAHVKSRHRGEALALERTIAYVMPHFKEEDAVGVGGEEALATGSTGKRSVPGGSAMVEPKRMKAEASEEILQTIGEIEGTIGALSETVEALKRKVDSAL